MKDELIKFDTAKLAKTKGFEEPCDWYLYTGDTGNNIDHELKGYTNHTNDVLDNLSFSLPTQSLLQCWLREKHKIHIDVKLVKEDLSEWRYEVGSLSGYSKTYEEALEYGLFEALKLIKG